MDNNSILLGVRADTKGLINDINKAMISVTSGMKPINPHLNDKGFTQPLGRITGQLSEFDKSLKASNARVLAFGSSMIIINSVKNSFKNIVGEAAKVEDSLNSINSILNISSRSLSSFGTNLFTAAKNTRQQFETAATVATEFSRQGLSANKVIERTNAALILTRLSGLNAQKSVEGLTSSLNGFSESALTAIEVVNKFSNVAQNFAVSEKDFSEAIGRTASTAQEAKISFDELLALVTVVQQKTARGGSVIGNAFKTIFARISRQGTIDQLRELGVQIDETQGGVDKLKALSDALRTADAATASQIKELSGGVRQINIISAALSDLSSNYSLYENALKIANSTTDEAVRRNEKMNESLSSLAARTKENIAQLASDIGSITISDNLKSSLEIINSFVDKTASVFTKRNGEEAGNAFGSGLIEGISNFLSGPVLVVAAGTIVKLLKNAFSFTKDLLQEFSSFNQESAKTKELQASILNILSAQDGKVANLISQASSQVQKQSIIRDIIHQQVNETEILVKLSKQLASSKGLSGYTVGKYGIAPKGTNMAEGYIPNAANGIADAFSRENKAIKSGVGGANSSARPILIKDFSFGNGKKQPIVVNSDEYLIKNFGSNGSSAILNKDMVDALGGESFIKKFGATKIENSAEGFGFNPKDIRSSSGRFVSKAFTEEMNKTLENYMKTIQSGMVAGVELASLNSKDAIKKLNLKSQELYKAKQREIINELNTKAIEELGPRLTAKDLIVGARSKMSQARTGLTRSIFESKGQKLASFIPIASGLQSSYFENKFNKTGKSFLSDQIQENTRQAIEGKSGLELLFNKNKILTQMQNEGLLGVTLDQAKKMVPLIRELEKKSATLMEQSEKIGKEIGTRQSAYDNGINRNVKAQMEINQLESKKLKIDKEISNLEGRIAYNKQMGVISSADQRYLKTVASKGISKNIRGSFDKYVLPASFGLSMASPFLEQLGGDQKTTTQKVAGSLGGAAQGAALGALFGPWGMAIGGIVGASTSLIEAFDQVKNSVKDLSEEIDKQKDVNQKLLSNISEYAKNQDILNSLIKSGGSSEKMEEVQRNITSALSNLDKGLALQIINSKSPIRSADKIFKEEQISGSRNVKLLETLRDLSEYEINNRGFLGSIRGNTDLKYSDIQNVGNEIFSSISLLNDKDANQVAKDFESLNKSFSKEGLQKALIDLGYSIENANTFIKTLGDDLDAIDLTRYVNSKINFSKRVKEFVDATYSDQMGRADINSNITSITNGIGRVSDYNQNRSNFAYKLNSLQFERQYGGANKYDNPLTKAQVDLIKEIRNLKNANETSIYELTKSFTSEILPQYTDKRGVLGEDVSEVLKQTLTSKNFTLNSDYINSVIGKTSQISRESEIKRNFLNSVRDISKKFSTLQSGDNESIKSITSNLIEEFRKADDSKLFTGTELGENISKALNNSDFALSSDYINDLISSIESSGNTSIEAIKNLEELFRKYQTSLINIDENTREQMVLAKESLKNAVKLKREEERQKNIQFLGGAESIINNRSGLFSGFKYRDAYKALSTSNTPIGESASRNLASGLIEFQRTFKEINVDLRDLVPNAEEEISSVIKGNLKYIFSDLGIGSQENEEKINQITSDIISDLFDKDELTAKDIADEISKIDEIIGIYSNTKYLNSLMSENIRVNQMNSILKVNESINFLQKEIKTNSEKVNSLISQRSSLESTSTNFTKIADFTANSIEKFIPEGIFSRIRQKGGYVTNESTQKAFNVALNSSNTISEFANNKDVKKFLRETGEFTYDNSGKMTDFSLDKLSNLLQSTGVIKFDSFEQLDSEIKGLKDEISNLNNNLKSQKGIRTELTKNFKKDSFNEIKLKNPIDSVSGTLNNKIKDFIKLFSENIKVNFGLFQNNKNAKSTVSQVNTNKKDSDAAIFQGLSENVANEKKLNEIFESINVSSVVEGGIDELRTFLSALDESLEAIGYDLDDLNIQKRLFDELNLSPIDELSEKLRRIKDFSKSSGKNALDNSFNPLISLTERKQDVIALSKTLEDLKKRFGENSKEVKTFIDELGEMKNAMPTSGFDRFALGFGTGLTSLEESLIDIHDIGQEVATSLSTGFGDAFVNALKGAESFGDGIRTVMANVASNIAAAYSQKAFTSLFQAVGFSSGGSVQKFASGGSVNYVSSNSDKNKVPTLLMGGEFVAGPDLVKKYGVNIFEDLNDGNVELPSSLSSSRGKSVNKKSTGWVSGGSGVIDDRFHLLNNGSFVINKKSSKKYSELLSKMASGENIKTNKNPEKHWLGALVGSLIGGGIGYAATGDAKGALMGALGGAFLGQGIANMYQGSGFFGSGGVNGFFNPNSNNIGSIASDAATQGITNVNSIGNITTTPESLLVKNLPQDLNGIPAGNYRILSGNETLFNDALKSGDLGVNASGQLVAKSGNLWKGKTVNLATGEIGKTGMSQFGKEIFAGTALQLASNLLMPSEDTDTPYEAGFIIETRPNGEVDVYTEGEIKTFKIGEDIESLDDLKGKISGYKDGGKVNKGNSSALSLKKAPRLKAISTKKILERANGGATNTKESNEQNFLINRHASPLVMQGNTISDTVLALLKEGEFVNRSESRNFWGDSFMNAVNNNDPRGASLAAGSKLNPQRFADGGGVGDMFSSNSSSSSSEDSENYGSYCDVLVNLNVYIDGATGQITNETVETSSSGDSSVSTEKANQWNEISQKIKALVKKEIESSSRPGGNLNNTIRNQK